jgi:hypothetical protein
MIDVGAEVALDLHHALGGEAAERAVDVAAEVDAVLVDRAQPLQREHLEAAESVRIGPVPLHELVQPAHVAHQLVARAAGAGGTRCEDHLCAHRDEVLGIERLDRSPACPRP